MERSVSNKTHKWITRVLFGIAVGSLVFALINLVEFLALKPSVQDVYLYTYIGWREGLIPNAADFAIIGAFFTALFLFSRTSFLSKRKLPVLISLMSLEAVIFSWSYTIASVAYLSVAQRYPISNLIVQLGELGGGFNSTMDIAHDSLPVFLFLLVVATSIICYRSVIKTIQIALASVLPLPILIGLFDHSEFNLHVIQLQATYNILPSFTNADLLLVCVAGLGLTYCYPFFPSLIKIFYSRLNFRR